MSNSTCQSEHKWNEKDEQNYAKHTHIVLHV